MDEKPKRGRPSKGVNIDPEQVRQCATKLWKTSEIAAFFRVDRKTIERHFSQIIEESREAGRSKIRDLQWKRALEGSDTMIKHLAEHHLDEHTKNRNEISTGENGFKIEIHDYTSKK